MTRIKDSSVEDVRAAVDMVDLVSGKTTLRRSGQPVRRPLPVPRGAHGVVLGRPGEEGLPLLRLPEGRRPHRRSSRRPRASTSSPRSSGWPTATASRSSTRTRPPRPASRASSAIGCCGCSTTRRCSTPDSCGRPARREGARAYLRGAGAHRGDRQDLPGRLCARAPGTGSARPRSRRGSPPPSSIAPDSRCAAGDGPVDRLRARVDVPADRSPGPRARVRWPADARR